VAWVGRRGHAGPGADGGGAGHPPAVPRCVPSESFPSPPLLPPCASTPDAQAPRGVLRAVPCHQRGAGARGGGYLPPVSCHTTGSFQGGRWKVVRGSCSTGVFTSEVVRGPCRISRGGIPRRVCLAPSSLPPCTTVS